MKAMNLEPGYCFKEKVFPTSPYERSGSKKIILAAKSGDLEGV